MDLFEFQARELFEREGVPVHPTTLCSTVDEVLAAASALFGSGSKAVLKAQVQVGGRGKAGGVRLVSDLESAQVAASEIFALDIKGHPVKSVLVAPAVDIASEFYLAITFDRSARDYDVIFSTEGGVDIETLASEHPEKIVRSHFSPLTGLTEEVAREAIVAASLRHPAGAARSRSASQDPSTPEIDDQIVDILLKLWQVYQNNDATLVEVNPLIVDAAGSVFALDAKVSLDDNAAFRHPGAPVNPKLDPIEERARELDINYVRLDGEVGVIGNGAGLVMSTVDLVALAGREAGSDTRPANFLDIGGGASAEKMQESLELILEDERVAVVFVNIFGGLTSCQLVAEGILGAVANLARPVQLVVRFDGNASEEGLRTLQNARNPQIQVAKTQEEAARIAVELVVKNR